MSDFLHHQLRRRHRAPYDWYRSIVSPQGASGTNYLKGEAALSSALSRYLKGDSALQIQSLIYLKGDAAFAQSARYAKGDANLVGLLNVFLKGDALFAANTSYLKGDASLMVNVPLEDLGESPTTTKPGILSRYWLSVEAVKKDVT